jgi:Leucine-rich repeat (LRR) protein
LPPEIGQLQNLKELWLESYSITELPPEIGQLQNLKELRIQANLTE